MLKINNETFEIKYTEINFRQRMYNKKSYITVNIMTEFYPSIVNERVISGSIDIKLDLNDIKSIDDLLDKKYAGDIGCVTISINNDGVWEHNICDKYEIELMSRKGKSLKFKLKTDNCVLNTEGTMVSLYTTSSTAKQLSKNFDLKDFLNNPIIKQIGNSTISRYFLK